MEKMSGTITIPADAWKKKVCGQYNKAKLRAFIEWFQNSLDAKATKVEIHFDDDTRTIVVADNGSGMDLETMLNAYLTLTGSYKPNANSSGAFGEAKELVFAMESYKIRTQNLLVEGMGSQYSITETPDWYNGCEFTVVCHESGDYNYDNFRSSGEQAAKMMEFPMEIWIDGELVPCEHPKGEKVRELIYEGEKVGTVYVDRSRKGNGYWHCRINGIFQFSRWAASECPPVTIELENNSTKFLIASREGVKYPYSNVIDKYLGELVASTTTALHPERELVKEYIKGEETQSIMDDVDLEFLSKKMENSYEDFARAFNSLVKVAGLDGALAAMRLAEMEKNANRYEMLNYYQERLAYFTFKYDVIAKYPAGNRTEARDFFDGGVQKSKRAKTLLSLWGEVLKQVLLDNDLTPKFTIGLNWEDDQEAQYNRDEKTGSITFFLNPRVLDNFPLTNKKMLVKRLRQLACHEVTHHPHHSWHDESFLVKYHKIEQNTWQSERLYDQIAKIKG